MQHIHSMSHLGDANKHKTDDFSWGHKRKVVGPNKDIRLYESFTFDGIEYFLYDNVYVWYYNGPEPGIGKLVKIWETTRCGKKVKVVWFFRPLEIQYWLGDVEPLGNEIFLACGEGKGLFNVTPLEAICGKCKVACTSKDRRNNQASTEELKRADYIFCRTFNVGNCTISGTFADKIDGLPVECFFNQTVTNPKIFKRNGKFMFSSKGTNSQGAVRTGKDDHSGVAEAANISCNQLEDREKIKSSENFSPQGEIDYRPLKKRKFAVLRDFSRLSPQKIRTLDAKSSPVEEKKLFERDDYINKANKSSHKVEQDVHHMGTKNSKIEVSRRPEMDTSKWFKQLPWEERLQEAREKGYLVLLDNLDPSYTSKEVEGMVRDAFGEKVSVKMIQRNTFSSPHYGQALVIFRSSDAAASAIARLKNKCLLLDDGRVVVARRGIPTGPDLESKFVGHLVINELGLQWREKQRKAVSTSHYSQSNTIEYAMAIEWCALQEKSDIWRNALHTRQGKEMESIQSKLKIG